MTKKQQILPLDGCVDLLAKLVGDFVFLSTSENKLPQKRIYKILSSLEPIGIERGARKAALAEFINGFLLKKYGIDTRNTNQEIDRNPRQNIQYYNRSQQYIDESDQNRLEAFAKLIAPLEMIKNKFGAKPEYFNSYARKLYDDVRSVLRIRDNYTEVFRPQMDYLEQLLYARYRISMDDLVKCSLEDLKEVILSKDENLLKRGSFMNFVDTNDVVAQSIAPAQPVVKDGNGGMTQESLVNAIFGNNKIRRDGEKVVERTVTITIRDQVID